MLFFCLTCHFTQRLYQWYPHVALYGAYHESIRKRDEGEQVTKSRINEHIRLF
jgi:hypothetical protein